MPETNEKPSFRNLHLRIAERASQGRNVVLSPSTALWLIGQLTALKQAVAAEDFRIRVEQWSLDDVRIEEVMAQCRNVIVGRAAFRAAVALRPTNRLYLRQGAMVLDHYEPPPSGR